MIENPKSGSVKKLTALLRKKDRLLNKKFVAEGPQAVIEALKHSPDSIISLYTTVTGRSNFPELDKLADAADVPIQMVSDGVFQAFTDTVKPQGVAALLRFAPADLSSVFQGAKLVAVLSEVRDPGNAGAVLRAADAAGADAVVFAGDSIDPWHPKVVRSTTGSLFHLPVCYGVSLADTVAAAKAAGLVTVAADIRGETLSPQAAVLRDPHAWVFGNEARGLTSADRELCDSVLRLPIYGSAESLNLATAAAVCLYSSAFAQRQLS